MIPIERNIVLEDRRLTYCKARDELY